jgi:putative flippase GtrA
MGIITKLKKQNVLCLLFLQVGAKMLVTVLFDFLGFVVLLRQIDRTVITYACNYIYIDRYSNKQVNLLHR